MIMADRAYLSRAIATAFDAGASKASIRRVTTSNSKDFVRYLTRGQELA